MKLESYCLFKEIFLRFSHILVISMGYTLLISSCPKNEVKVGKLPIIEILYQNYFEGQTYGSFLLNCTNISLFVLCRKSQL